jgi:Ca2+-transporting ATPase
LTKNEMVVSAIVNAAGDAELGDGQLQPASDDLSGLARRVLRIGVLCNSGSLNEKTDGAERRPRGDPMEIALLEAGQRSGLPRDELVDRAAEVGRVPFDRETMMMATFHQGGEDVLVAVKGAPQAVLQACDRVAGSNGDRQVLDDDARDQWLDRASALASTGLRLLAMAEKTVGSTHVDPYEGLCFLGLAALQDPPRTRVRDAINACQAAGIRVVMVTGDKPETAESIAEQVGIVGDPDDEPARVLHGRDMRPPSKLGDPDEERVRRANIVARVTPEQKLNLVRTYQDVGETVAMTGDGINDAPALKKADIGVAMGRRGTDAAKQAADMVLRDDAFETIVAAVEQGRIIFGNIRKSVLFMLCTNGAEVLAVAIAAAVNAPLPLRPLQILFLNVLTDVFPALALAVGKGEGDVMQRPPRRPDEAVLARRHWLAIGGWSVIIAMTVLVGLATALQWLGFGTFEAVTVSFLTLGFAKLWFAFNLRSPNSSPVRNEVTRNPWIWGAIGLCTALLVSAVYLPGLSSVLETRPIGWGGWGLVLGMSLVPLLLGQLLLLCRKHWPQSGDRTGR